jgi:prepilin peptidase CpaA
MNSIPALQIAVLLPAVTIAAGFDWRSRRIPNWLVAFIAVSGLLVIAVEFGISKMLISLAVGTCAGAAFLPLYAVNSVSAGDVKLIAATSVWWTVAQLIVALAATAICGAILAIGYLCLTRGATHIPYAVAIAASAFGTVLTG